MAQKVDSVMPENKAGLFEALLEAVLMARPVVRKAEPTPEPPRTEPPCHLPDWAKGEAVPVGNRPMIPTLRYLELYNSSDLQRGTRKQSDRIPIPQYASYLTLAPVRR